MWSSLAVKDYVDLGFESPSDTSFSGRGSDAMDYTHLYTDDFPSFKPPFSSGISPYEGMVIVPFVSFMAQHLALYLLKILKSQWFRIQIIVHIKT